MKIEGFQIYVETFGKTIEEEILLNAKSINRWWSAVKDVGSLTFHLIAIFGETAFHFSSV